MLRAKAVVAIYDFENRRQLFGAVDSRARFAVLVLSRRQIEQFDVAFWLQSTEELQDPQRTQRLSMDALSLLDHECLAIPQFRDPKDLRILLAALAAHVRFAAKEEFAHTMRLMFSSSDAAFSVMEFGEVADDRAKTVRDGKEPEWLPVYEGKMVGLFDHRKADIVINLKNQTRPAQDRELLDDEKRDPDRFARPQFWIRSSAVRNRRFGERSGQKDWELVFCDVTSASNERTSIPCIVPLSGLNRSLPAITCRRLARKPHQKCWQRFPVWPLITLPDSGSPRII